LIPRTVAVTPSDRTETRGLVAAVGKKILKILVFPLLDPLIGRVVGEYFVQKWEAKKRPYTIRTFTSSNYGNSVAPSVTAGDWAAWSGKRVLLMVHGIFSRTDAAFGDMPQAFVQQLCRMYDDRVFAFDHPTLSEDPNQNAKWFVDNMPENADLEVDIICHSRGGLVSRVLAEKQSALPMGSRQVAVRRVVFVATPNAGTLLSDTRHLGDFIDTYTNLLNFFPPTGVVDVLEGIITVVKQLAVATAKGLSGIQSALPDGTFLRGLNTGPKDMKQYFALASNFEPTDPGLKAFAQNRLMDAIFNRADNDLVVPTAGVYEMNGSDFFPIADREVFPAAAGIPHTGFFADASARARILGWLKD
jgi:pimeloyl-ACP methyl ester carboxylesterase